MISIKIIYMPILIIFIKMKNFIPHKKFKWGTTGVSVCMISETSERSQTKNSLLFAASSYSYPQGTSIITT